MALLTGLRVPQPHWRPKGLMLLMMVLIVLSCTSGKASYDRALIRPGAVLDVEQGELADAQRHSLEYLFYRNNPLPKVPSARELRNLERDLAAAPPVEVEELRRLFGNDLELLAYATRDSDGDGVLDYRISEYRGKFFEGDIDVDGDGVRNVYDIAPYDPKVGGVDTDGDGIPDLIGSFADRDGDGIPDHLDWSPRKPEALATIQSRLFRDFGVILVERSARFTPEMVQAADDALRLVFREPMPTLRTIAIEDQLLISPDLGDNGFMVGQTQTLTIYSKSLEGSPPLVVLGLFIHELDHAWQLAQDFDADDLAVENKRLHFPHGKFTSSLEGYGWAADPKSMGDGYQHVLYWPHFYSTAPRYEYRDSTPAEWAEWFETLEAEQGDAFLRSSAVTSRGLVGTYALTSPWEWHADYLMASVYNRLDRRLDARGVGSMAGPTAVLRGRMLQAVQTQWSRYDYRNAAGTMVDRDFARGFPLSDDELDRLIERYVLPLADLPLLSQALALEVEELANGPFANWAEVATAARASLELAPELAARLARAQAEARTEKSPDARSGDRSGEGPGEAQAPEDDEGQQEVGQVDGDQDRDVGRGVVTEELHPQVQDHGVDDGDAPGQGRPADDVGPADEGPGHQ